MSVHINEATQSDVMQIRVQGCLLKPLSNVNTIAFIVRMRDNTFSSYLQILSGGGKDYMLPLILDHILLPLTTEHVCDVPLPLPTDVSESDAVAGS